MLVVFRRKWSLVRPVWSLVSPVIGASGVLLLWLGLVAVSAAQEQEGDAGGNAAPVVEAAASERPAARDAAVAAAAQGGQDAHPPGAAHPNLGKDLGLWTMLPFAGTLLSIAVLPLVAGHWWEHNTNKGIVAAAFAIPVAIYLVAAFGRDGIAVLNHAVLGDYVPFIVLLGALYIISGGIVVEGSLSGTPLLNTGIMAFGAVIANLIGTTGASVLLIRPLLRANAPRKRKAHIVLFFIFTVSNCGGLLTPLGDPPLFMGFQAGVPFLWTAALWKEWLMVNTILLVLFNIWDQIVLQKEELAGAEPLLEEVQHHAPLRVLGLRNVVFLLGVVLAIFAQGQEWLSKPMQVLTLLVLTGTAYAVTPKVNREKNRFTFGPIIEVAVLFAGIFVTMAPALLILNAWGSGERQVLGMTLGLSQPWEYFWATGVLSSFLDNAPTYLTFAATASGQQHIVAEGQYLRQLLATETGPALLAAVSCGAVFMGANTYIGNGPNFMVKAIAEEGGVKMPSFFGYMLYSGAILLPVFALVTLVFFRG
jgi:Na+/H+ antiporter NhaD/arsenite permease-like protein